MCKSWRFLNHRKCRFQVVPFKPSTGYDPAQPPRIAELRAIFDRLEDQSIIDRLQKYRPTGRQGYSLWAMWRAYLASFVLNLPHTNGLIRELEDDPLLREVCGFDPTAQLPHRRTFNRFIRRLADHANLIEVCFAQLTDRLKELLPDLGQEVAIDASVVRTHANPKKGADPEASWGVTHSPQSRNRDGVEWVFGYKVHLVADANYGIPLAQFVTTGSKHESPRLPELVDRARGMYEWFMPEVAIADRGYDSAANHQFLWLDRGIKPVIHIRKPSNTDLYQGIYTKEGVPTCLGMVPMEYVATDGKGHHLYRCRQEGCHLQSSPKGGIRHCDTTYLQNPEEDLRLFGVIRRNSKQWKAIYAKRWSVERVFKSAKESRRLERHCLRRLNQINLHALMSTLTYQVSALVKVLAGDMSFMRWMVRKVA